MSRSKFEEWWKKLKPAEVDEVKEYFEECWLAGRESMREDAAKVCGDMKADASPDQCAEAILRIEP